MYPTPQQGSSLLLSFSFSLQQRTILVIGSTPLSALRTFSSLEAGAKVLILAEGGLQNACEEIKWRVDKGEVGWVDWDGSVKSLETLVDEEDVWMAFVTTTSVDSSETKLKNMYETLRGHHVLTNITDHPGLCDFGFTATHRFSYTPSTSPVSASPSPPTSPATQTQTQSPLQIAITTNGHGCRLASRLRREIVARLPKETGEAVRRVGLMRRMVLDEAACASFAEKETAKDASQARPSSPGQEPPSVETKTEQEPKKTRQLRWLAQISEYWPIEKLASLEEGEMRALLDEASLASTLPATTTAPQSIPAPLTLPSQHFGSLSPPLPAQPVRRGEIYLVGSGPGHPALLTVAAYQLLTGSVLPSSSSSTKPDHPISLILSDKLVPTPILSLVPPTVRVVIARKFPGNADASQLEMMRLAVEGARRGERVMRLKQGDPGVYARLAEEYLYFSQHGFVPLIVPGLSSALVGPLVATPGPSRLSLASPLLPIPPPFLSLSPLQPLQTPISLTSRGISDSFIVLTGVGKGGKHLSVPSYERGRSVVLLMGVGRLRELVGGMIGGSTTSASPSRVDYPAHLPTTIIERASLPDQRIISSTLRDIISALECTGEQRAPAMVVVGWCCLGVGWGGVDVELDEKADEEGGNTQPKSYDDLLSPCSNTEPDDIARVQHWLGKDENGVQRRWRVSEGLDWRWREIFGGV